VVGVKDEPERFHVVAYDFGIKQNILRKLRGEGCKVTVVPAQTTGGGCAGAEARRSVSVERSGRSRAMHLRSRQHSAPDGAAADLWNLPGTPAHRNALGGKTFKLKFGHHGGNHPVKQLASGKIEITAHNHNFAVDPDSLPQSEVELTHIDLNDQTLEGMRHRNLPLFTVQYHPEAAPGPHDSHYLFKDFVKMMEECKR
jgi:carbamoyl-phosphate synthase small subunit